MVVLGADFNCAEIKQLEWNDECLFSKFSKTFDLLKKNIRCVIVYRVLHKYFVTCTFMSYRQKSFIFIKTTSAFYLKERDWILWIMSLSNASTTSEIFIQTPLSCTDDIESSCSLGTRTQSCSRTDSGIDSKYTINDMAHTESKGRLRSIAFFHSFLFQLPNISVQFVFRCNDIASRSSSDGSDVSRAHQACDPLSIQWHNSWWLFLGQRMQRYYVISDLLPLFSRCKQARSAYR